MVTLASEFPNDNPALHRGVIWVCHDPTGHAVPERTVAEPVGDPESELEIIIEELEPIEARVEGIETLEGVVASEAEPVVASEPEPVVASEHEHVVASEPEPVVASEHEHVVASEAEPVVASEPEHEHEHEHERIPPRVSEIVLVAAREQADDKVESTPAVEPEPIETATAIMSAAPSVTLLPPPTDDPFAALVSKLVDVAVSAGALDVAAILPELLESGQVAADVGAQMSDALKAAGLWDGTEVTPAFMRVTRAWRDILRGTSEDFDACGGATLDEWASEVLSKLLGAPARSPMLRQELRSRGVAAFGLAA